MTEKPTYEELEQRIRDLEASESKSNRTLEALKQKEYLYGDLFKNMLHEVHIWKLIFDDSGKIKTWKLVDANSAALKSWNRSLSEVVGKTPDEMFPGSGVTEQFKPVVEKIFSEGRPHIWESYFPGTNHFFHMISIPLGKYFISTGLDITEPEEAEEILNQKHEMLKNTEAMAHIGSWVWDVQSDRAYWSEELFLIFGRNPAQGAPSFADQSELYGDGDMQRLQDAVENSIKRGTSYEIELRAIRTDGEIRHCISRGKPQYDENGEVFRIAGSFQDITERKQAEEERKNLQEQLAQAQKLESVGRLAGGVAHDFNNMLGVILGHTELALLQADENHDLYSDLKEIQKAGNRSANITKQLLAFARKQTISPRQMDLNYTVESMLNMLRRLIGEDIDLVWQPGTHLWPVKMDPTQIDQILANLCINARDAIAGVGKLTIETGWKTFDVEYCNEHSGFISGDFVLLAVSDNGCGMDKNTLDNLYEPFFTTKEVGKGTGLGLATVYGIVKQNNGFINVYTELGQGSTFKIYLPRLVVEKDVDKAAPEKKAVAGGTETILVVEDEPSLLSMARLMLERKGYSVLTAATPAEAIALAEKHADKIHLLMTDVVMPEMNGRDLAVKITALYPDIKLLFMSGYTSNVIAHQGVLDDGVAFIQKPFLMADMTAKVREVLDKA